MPGGVLHGQFDKWVPACGQQHVHTCSAGGLPYVMETPST